MLADLAPSCKLELTSLLPSVGLPKATVRFPFGEVSVLEENENEEEEEVAASSKLSVSGILKGEALNGICSAQYADDTLNLRYAFKVFTSLSRCPCPLTLNNNNNNIISPFVVG